MLDFALWERDQIEPGGARRVARGAWPPRRTSAIGRWLAGIDSELVGLILRRGARIYDLSQEEPPEEPEGTFYPTPDGLFVLDVRWRSSRGAQDDGDADPTAGR